MACRNVFSMFLCPAVFLSDNGSQMVGAARELRQMIQGHDPNLLRDFCAKIGTQWIFTTPAVPHPNGCAEALVKSCKRAIKNAIGEQVLSLLELYMCFMEIGNLVNQRPIGHVPNDPDDGKYLCSNDTLLGRATSEVPQGPFSNTKNPRKRVEFVQTLVNSFWKRWSRNVQPVLVPRKVWQNEKRNVRVKDIVMVADTNAIRGKWSVGKEQEVFPGSDSHTPNVKVKLQSGEYT